MFLKKNIPLFSLSLSLLNSSFYIFQEKTANVIVKTRKRQHHWRAVPFASTVEPSGLIDLKSGWLNLCGKNCLPPTGLASGQLAPWILWQIWCARNQLVFEGKAAPEEEVLTKAITYAKEWTNSQEKISLPPRKPPPYPRPVENCSVLNTDAAWRASNLSAGLGWTIKSQAGMREFSKPTFFVRSALVAEGLALREEIWKCKEQGIKRLRCESDSSQLIKALNSGDSHPELYGIIADVLNYSSFFEVISFSWVSRCSNKAADMLVKQCMVEGEAFMADT